MSRSKIDQFYRRLLLAKFFVKGWGKPEHLHRLFSFRKIMSNKKLCYKLVDPNTPVHITKAKDEGSYMLYEGYFMSPFEKQLPGLMPKSCQQANFQMILPHKWENKFYKPVCIQLAGTGDHGFWKRRTIVAKPLLQEHGIASIMLENPFYGRRKPPEQVRSSLLNVSDLFVMGGCLILECMVLLHWCNRMRLGPVGLSGMSMGGHMASLAAVSWPRPVPLIPCLSWTTASGVFTQGVLSGAINWDLLKHQYLSNSAFRNELFNLIRSPEGHFSVYHEAGQHFAREYPGSMKDVADIVKDDIILEKKSSSSSASSTTSSADAESSASFPDVNSKQQTTTSEHNDPRVSYTAPPEEASSYDSHKDCNTSDINDSRCNSFEFSPTASADHSGRHGDGEVDNIRVDANNKTNDKTNEGASEESPSSSSSTSSSSTFSSTPSSASDFPPQFSHVDSLSNELNSLGSATGIKLRSPDSDHKSGVSSSGSSSTSGLLDPPSTAPSSQTNAKSSPESSIIRPGVPGGGGGGGFSSFGLQSIRHEVPAIITSAVASAGRIGGKVGKSIITNLNPFSYIGHLNYYKEASKPPPKSVSSSTKTSTSPKQHQHQQQQLQQQQQHQQQQQQQQTESSQKGDSLMQRYRASRIISLLNYRSRQKSSPVKPDTDDPHMGFSPVGIRPSPTTPDYKLVTFKPYFTVKDPMTWEALQFMRGIMDECTHLANFDQLEDPELAIIIQAKRDAYEPVDSIIPLNEVWPGSELRIIDTGHIVAFVMYQTEFRTAINDSFLRTYARYKDSEDWTQGGQPPIPPTDL